MYTLLAPRKKKININKTVVCDTTTVFLRSNVKQFPIKHVSTYNSTPFVMFYIPAIVI